MPSKLSYLNMEMTITFILLHFILEKIKQVESIMKFMITNSRHLLLHLKIDDIFLERAQRKVTVYTDHKNLEYFMSAILLNRRQAR